MVFNTRHGVVSICDKPFDKRISDSATQDANGGFDAMTECGRLACEKAALICDAVVIVSTWHSLLLCDRDSKPLDRLLLWSDLSSTLAVQKFIKVPNFAHDFYKRTGCIAHATYPFFKYAYLKETKSLDENVQLYAHGEYIFNRLTGIRVVPKNIASGSGFFNLNTKTWDADILKIAGVNASQLGTVCDETFAAPLSEDGAKALGILKGTPVFSGGADGAMTQLGCGAVRNGVMTVSVGTSAAMRIVCDEPLLPEEMTTWCYYLSAGKYIAGAATNGACNCVNLFRNESGLQFNELDALLDEINFENAPVYLPFIFGERSPGFHNKAYGGFVTHGGSLAQRYYAVLEGVLFNLYQCYLPLVAINGIPNEIRLSGGILNCRYWLQMFADIFGRQIQISEQQHASLLGGAKLVANALGEGINGEIWNVKRIISPNIDKQLFYKERFCKYLECYSKAGVRGK